MFDIFKFYVIIYRDIIYRDRKLFLLANPIYFARNL